MATEARDVDINYGRQELIITYNLSNCFKLVIV